MALLLWASSSQGDVVRGVIRDGAFDSGDKAAPIAGALVRCQPEALAGRVVQRRTDAEGRFFCEDMPAGRVSVEFEKLGYVPKPGTREIDVAGEAEVELELYNPNPATETYWQGLAAKISKHSQEDYLPALERLRAIGLGPEGLSKTADYLARSLPPDQAPHFEERLAAFRPPRDDSKTAQEALERAVAAGKLAEGRLLYELTLTDDRVRFAFDKADLGEESKAALTEFAEHLTTENSNVYVEIQGHTDSVGSEGYNYELGLERAEAVRRFLSVNTGLPLDRMEVISYGDSSPIADNETREGRSQNRRVVLVVLR
jgi:outer membrane protein OmpA-like peptidoglycan-associated protein